MNSNDQSRLRIIADIKATELQRQNNFKHTKFSKNGEQGAMQLKGKSLGGPGLRFFKARIIGLIVNL